MGPGFDCLSAALCKYLKIEAEISDKLNILIKGKGADSIRRDENNLIYRAFKNIFMKLNPRKIAPRLELMIENDIPVARGLGSSACAVTAGVILGYLFSEIAPDKEKIFNQAVPIEGHADNAGACVYGGVRVNKKISDEKYISAPFDMPYKINAHLVIPDFEINTREARKILPEEYKKEEVVSNIGSMGLLLASLRSGNWDNIKYCGDYVHEPYRLSLSKPLSDLFNKLKETVSGWVFLSGSGSTIVIMEKEDNPIAAGRIQKIIDSQKFACEYEKTSITGEGAIWH